MVDQGLVGFAQPVHQRDVLGFLDGGPADDTAASEVVAAHPFIADWALVRAIS